MKVVESDVRLESSHEARYRQSCEVTANLSFRRVAEEVAASRKGAGEEPRERLTRLLEQLVDALLAAMEGKNCRSVAADCRPSTAAPAAQPSGPAGAPPGGREIAWERRSVETIEDYERTRVAGRGVVKTADGRNIDFKLAAEFCRDYRCTRESRERGTVVLHDPLVLNFAGKAAELTAERIAFDLDADDRAESLPGLGRGSAYLVLDRNGNGKVDDGREVFGAVSGDAFADLAKLDDDHNGWLDEGDAAFARLRLWDGRPDDAPAALAGREVGAIWLGSVASPFAIKDDANALLGEIRAAGVFLKEDGEVGTVQQIDLASRAASDEAASRPAPGGAAA